MAFQPNGPTANGGPGGGGPPPPMFFNPAQYSSSVAAPPGPPPPPSQPSKQQPQQPQSMVQYIIDEKHPIIASCFVFTTLSLSKLYKDTLYLFEVSISVEQLHNK